MTAKIPMTAQNSGLAKITLLVFSLTLFLSASIMFAVQPMVGKMLLPLVGGTPSGWIVAMAFFQIMLLVGYLLAHGLSKISTRRHGALYVFALLVGTAFMPVGLIEHTGRVGSNPAAVDIFLILTFAVAVPFVALSATSSTIQRLFTTTGHSSAHDPYFLYAASNMGSFAGLLLYPLVVEPLFTLSEQARALTFVYTALILFAVFCLILTGRHKAPETATANAVGTPTTPVSGKTYLYWMALAFVPSSLLLGVTMYITTDIMSVPMIWVFPLCLYLLTFIIAFSKKPIVSLKVMELLHPWVVLAAVMAIGLLKFTWLGKWTGIFFYLGIFTVVALACHMRLASLRPLDSQRHHLTGFYLMMSVGGALGGILNAFIIPFISNRLIELPLVLVGSLLLHPALRIRSAQGGAILAILGITTLMLNITPPQLGLEPQQLSHLVTAAVLLSGISFIFPWIQAAFRPASVMLISASLLLFSQFTLTEKSVIHSLRNFYGTIRVYEEPLEKNGQHYTVRMLKHGTTVHGMQILTPEKYRTLPINYYSPDGPLGDIFKYTAPKSVAGIGLGAGVINCHTAPDRSYTFIEIDQGMVDTARDHFSFMSECTSKAPPKIIVGDGRLELAKIKDQKFDLVIVDAFSSDSIPTHLLTLEALREYMSALNEDGMVAMHLSNRYFVLEDIITVIAKDLNLAHRFKFDRKMDMPFRTASKWIVLARNSQTLSVLQKKDGWETLTPDTTRRAWTDDYSNIMSVMQAGYPVATQGEKK